MDVLVKASSLSPIKMAASCWFLFKASFLQSRRNCSMVRTEGISDYKAIKENDTLISSARQSSFLSIAESRFLCVQTNTRTSENGGTTERHIAPFGKPEPRLYDQTTQIYTHCLLRFYLSLISLEEGPVMNKCEVAESNHCNTECCSGKTLSILLAQPCGSKR